MNQYSWFLWQNADKYLIVVLTLKSRAAIPKAYSFGIFHDNYCDLWKKFGENFYEVYSEMRVNENEKKTWKNIEREST